MSYYEGFLNSLRVALVLLVSVFSSALFAQSTLSVKESVQFAVKNSPILQKAKLETRKSLEQIREYKSTGLPQVNASLGFTYNLKLPTQLIPNFFQGKPDELVPVQFGTDLNTTAGAEVNQLLYSQQYWVGIKAIKAVGNFNSTVELKTEEDVAYNVVKLYYQVQTISKQKDLIEANLQQVGGLLKATDLQYQNGLAKKLDVDQLRVNLITLQTQLQNLELNYEQGLQALKFAMSMPQESQLVLSDTLSEVVMPNVDPTYLEASYQNKLDLTLLDQQTTLQQLNADQLRATSWPTLRAFGNYNFQGQGNGFGELGKDQNWFSFSAVGLNVNIPIFDGFYRKSKVEQVKIDMLKIAEDRKQTMQSLQLQHSQAKQQLLSYWNTLNALRENRKVAEEVYNVTQKRYKEGVANVTEVLVAERTMREVQSNFLANLLQYQLAKVDLDYANGKIPQLYK
ncbi:MAG TPA: TolC family protein [Haliscomenobacter sp.]|uniref:TolC family protein n=1 Tax=Haliscomenobacter sp. TaxID=2717303 RepID=UPI002B96F4F2|nr:TolC family protein [Haliscomenobacter sp.]HOY20708.1 TolC family protein [Haliscomenobacter sp.]HPH18646.1 TolC family protein [Haliscomenobacter sp.]